MWGVIGGTGFEGLSGFEVEELVCTDTPFGKTSLGFKRAKIGNQTCFYIPRHGSHHDLTPSEVNYRANIYALKMLGVTKLLTLSAVGSLRKKIKPGDVAICSQFVNRTQGLRGATFCGQGIVGHVSLSQPVWAQAIAWLRAHAKKLDTTFHFDKTYVCIEGPFFSTRAESHMHRALGHDIVGMTAYPEYALAREAGMCYLPLSFVCDYDCWADDLEHVSIDQIVTNFARNRNVAFSLLIEVLNAKIEEDSSSRNGHLGNCLLSSKDHLQQTQADLLEVLSR